MHMSAPYPTGALRCAKLARVLHHRTDDGPTDRYNEDGSATHGATFVGDDHVLRFFPHDVTMQMKGLGAYSGEWGYNVYDDGAGP